MVREISPQPVIGTTKPASITYTGVKSAAPRGGSRLHYLIPRSVLTIYGAQRSGPEASVLSVLAVLAAVLLFIIAIPCSHAESMASKNREGNKLFSENKYAEAEKAYLDAQAKSPGKPEVIYNYGNSLIKQNKLDQGIQALHQSMSQGNSEIKTRSWYNTGNALFSKGSFQDAAQAYIQALKLNPSDKDAKHNLELSLMKLNQQKQKQNDPKQKQQNSKDQKQSQSAQKNANNNPNKPNPQKAGEKQQPETSKQQAGSISKEQAQQILDAFQSRELEEQRKLRERRTGQRSNERDW
jgi:tetratricopeptide (TPR) repeat protein